MKRLYYDIETSPNIVLSWRTGYNLSIPTDNILQERAIICIAYKWEGKKAECLTWNKGNDKEMLYRFTKILEQADESVAHNGDRFDLKWIRTRCLKHGIPFSPFQRTIDTLKIARNSFNFQSNKLDYLAKYLGLDRKLETEYGWWKDILLNNCLKAMHKMTIYCKKDVEVLEQVYDRLKPYTKAQTNYSVLYNNSKSGCPECKSKKVGLNKTYTTVTGIVRHTMQCHNCNRYFTIPDTIFKQWLQQA